MMARVSRFPVLVILAWLALGASGASAEELTGTIHGHTAYSDGYPGSTPRSVAADVKADGNDFLALTDHSDTLDVPFSASQYCIPPTFEVAATCAVADAEQPANALRKWPSTLEQLDLASNTTFTGIRGFEWTSDRFGHINVLFSSNQTNAKVDGGYVALETFYAWLKRAPELAGGADGLAVFNHPGAKSLSEQDPGFNWNDFAYDPSLEDKIVGMEVFNTTTDYASPMRAGAGADGWYVHALDRGWHLAAIGAEDLGHFYGDDWGGPAFAKTVILSADRSRAAIKSALAARRTYAVRQPGYRMSYTLEDAPMGSRLERPVGAPLRVVATTGGSTDRVAPGHHLEADLLTSGGTVVASAADGRLETDVPAAAGQAYYFVRMRDVPDAGRGTDYGEAVGFSSPIWVRATPGGPTGSTGPTATTGSTGSTGSTGDAAAPAGGATTRDTDASVGSPGGGDAAVSDRGTSGPAGVAGPAGVSAVDSARVRGFRAAVRVRRGQTLRSLRRRGLLVQIGCDLRCRTRVTISLSGGRQVARRTVALSRPGRREVALRPGVRAGRFVVRTVAASHDGQTKRQQTQVRIR